MTSFPSHMPCNTVQVTGYDYHFVDEQSVLQDYKCILCLSVARDPKQFTCCGKIVCTICLERCIHNFRGPSGSSAPACPHCRDGNWESFSDRRSHQKIISLKVQCTYSHNGCIWVGELKTFEERHYPDCVFQVTECPDCKENVPKKHLKDHTLRLCKKRKTKCPHCPCENTYEYIYETHKMTCKYWLVDCPSGCDKRMTRSEIEKHRETCLLQIVPCRYNENGCQVMVERKNLKNHEEECSMKVIVSNALTRGQQQIKEENEKSLTAPLMFRFEQFQRHKNDKEKWTSQPFYCYNSGYRVCLVVYPNGCGRSSSGSHLSCYIHLHHGHFDDELQWPFRGTIKVSLRNQIEDGSHHEKQFKFCTGHSSGINKKPEKQSINDLGIGEPLFIRQDWLEKNDVKYLKNDELVFHIDYEPPVTQKYNCHIVSGYRY